MKTIATAIAAVVITFSASTQADARPHCGTGYSTTRYISGYARCGTPIYTERFLIRIDCHGHPVWGYRTLPVVYRSSHSHGGYDRGRDYRDSGYSRRDDYRDSDYSRHDDYDHRGSRSSVNFEGRFCR